MDIVVNYLESKGHVLRQVRWEGLTDGERNRLPPVAP